MSEWQELAVEDEKTRQAKRAALWGEDRWKPQEPKSPAAVSPPAVLNLLNYPHAANGQPLETSRFAEPPPPPPGASDQEHSHFQAYRHRIYQEFLAGEGSDRARWNFWVGLKTPVKNQLAADVHNLKQPEGTPWWRVSTVTNGEQPDVYLRAADPVTATLVYRELYGLIFVPQQPSGESGVVAVACAPPAHEGNGHAEAETP
jgi:hypothetical protein